jgi:hypothetical protein
MRVAVLGAGFQGTCIALELADRGVEVDLYDKNEQPVTQAGFVNEGKIHLGFNYANDPGMATAELMCRGALVFGTYLNRWIDFEAEAEQVSDQVHYAIHRDSLVPVEDIRSYGRRVCDTIFRNQREGSGDYLGMELDAVFEELDRSELEEMFNPYLVTAAFRTSERSVNVASIADRLRDAVISSKKINFRPHSKIHSASLHGDQIRLEIHDEEGGVFVKPDNVINALWDGRIAIDSDVGYTPKRPWLHRFKYGVFVDAFDPTGIVPSVAVACGPFGDIVRHENGNLYLSWYPTCMKSISSDLIPPSLPQIPTMETSQRIFDDTWKFLSRICPVLDRLGPIDDCRFQVLGGTIFAWGETDIDRIESALHARGDVGLFSNGNYHSVNTGKYTLAPLFAMEVADRVCGLK